MKPPPSKPWPWVALASLLLLAGFKLIWLFAEPPPSVADNGDYWRVARPAGLEHVEGARIDGTRPSQWFRVIPPAREAGLSSPALIAATARAIGAREERLDIRWVGAIHVAALLVVAGLGWSVAGGWRAGGVLVLFLVVLCDAAYLPFFNSFYAEGVMLIAVVGAGLWLLADDAFAGLRWTLAGTALTLLGSLTKPLYAGFGLVLIATLLVGPKGRRLVRARLSLAALLLAAAAGPLWFAFGPGPQFVEINRYHAVFAGLAAASPEPERTLEALDVPLEYRDFPRTDVFRARIDPDHVVFDAISHISRPRLVAAYLTEPAALRHATERVIGQLAAAKSHTRAILAARQRHQRYQLRPTDFSFWRASLLAPHPLVAAGVWLALVAGATALAARRGSPVATVLAFLVLWAVLQSVGAVVGDGFVSLRQHLIAARFAVDVAALLAFATLGAAAVGRFRGGPQPRRPPGG